MGANQSHPNMRVFGPRQEMAVVFLLDVVLEKHFLLVVICFVVLPLFPISLPSKN